LFSLALVACGGETVAASGGSADASSGDGASSSGRVPLHHRPDDSQCRAPVPPGNCASSGHANDPLDTCTSDPACTAGINGRCVFAQVGGPAHGCGCAYDTCTFDTDCPTGELCVCHQSPFTLVSGNFCNKGGCRVDADCGPGGYCSPSEVCGFVQGHYCHGPTDTCIDDGDCPARSFCNYDAAMSAWGCRSVGPCP
jgi:hypothetical protein